ncbi:YcxB family protein [Actinomadura macrotermitis]|uniref:YcxB-like C-terminal domain-containing protein n=1 Tax=Actinomadura macrotermitis TaxID=2585200 RepID=A0A7K0BSS6_9ACTN|nr:YcxB family protein [Actinomadura macrotermitis]MQY04211.1 hypothetical protein [Actinomadura macrotermitis]
MTDFTVSYEPTPDEVARALHQGLKLQLRFLYLALPVLLVLAGAACLLTGALYLGVGLLALAGAFPLALSWMIQVLAGRQLGHLCAPTTLVVTADGYEYRTEHTATTARWARFDRIVTTQEFWLLFTGGRCTAFLPKRAFTMRQEVELDGLFGRIAA